MGLHVLGHRLGREEERFIEVEVLAIIGSALVEKRLGREIAGGVD